MIMKKRLYKDHSDKKLCGVCSGIAKYFGIDPTLVRLAWTLLIVFGGSGVLAYIICAIVFPDEPGYIEED
jgi:phage shock protein PspC (stress-responsive transcriptional regulator)